MITARSVYSYSQTELDPTRKVWIKSSQGEFTAFDAELHIENDNETIYLAKLHNDKQMTLADLQALIPKSYYRKEKRVKLIFPDEIEGLSVQAYPVRLADQEFGKGEDYFVIATFENLMNVVKKHPFYQPQHRTVGLDYLKADLFGYDDERNAYRDRLDLNPIFQRGHVWTVEQQISFVENFLRRPQSVDKNIYFNDGWIFNKLKPNEENSFIAGKRVCLDGLQRLTALLDFIDGKFACFDGQVTWEKIEKAPNKHVILGDCNLDIYDFTFTTNKEVIDFYVDFNACGVPHTADEIERVKALLK